MRTPSGLCLPGAPLPFLARSGAPHNSAQQKTSRKLSLERPETLLRDSLSRAVSVSSFWQLFSLLASIFLLNDFPLTSLHRALTTDHCRHFGPAASLTPDIAVSARRCQSNSALLERYTSGASRDRIIC